MLRADLKWRTATGLFWFSLTSRPTIANSGIWNKLLYLWESGTCCKQIEVYKSSKNFKAAWEKSLCFGSWLILLSSKMTNFVLYVYVLFQKSSEHSNVLIHGPFRQLILSKTFPFQLYAIFNCLLGESKFEFVLDYEQKQIGKCKIKATKICDWTGADPGIFL